MQKQIFLVLFSTFFLLPVISHAGPFKGLRSRNSHKKKHGQVSKPAVSRNPVEAVGDEDADILAFKSAYYNRTFREKFDFVSLLERVKKEYPGEKIVIHASRITDNVSNGSDAQSVIWDPVESELHFCVIYAGMIRDLRGGDSNAKKKEDRDQRINLELMVGHMETKEEAEARYIREVAAYNSPEVQEKVNKQKRVSSEIKELKSEQNKLLKKIRWVKDKNSADAVALKDKLDKIEGELFFKKLEEGFGAFEEMSGKIQKPRKDALFANEFPDFFPTGFLSHYDFDDEKSRVEIKTALLACSQKYPQWKFKKLFKDAHSNVDYWAKELANR